MVGTDHEFLAPGLPQEPQSQRMTNEDFRKLMATPRAGQTPASSSSGSEVPGGGAMNKGANRSKEPRSARYDKGKAEERRKRKTYYAKLKKDEDEKMAELAAKYRDRASERRDGTEGVPAELDSTTSAYRAVAPNARENHDAAERRRQMINESKYLGGDMEHTHLVKGLDFALLQKVRAEIFNKEQQEDEEGVEEEEEETETKKNTEEDEKKEEKKKTTEDVEEVSYTSDCITVVGKNIVRTLFKPEIPKVNELFLAGRMAYVMDLEDETESDIPTTSIRSKMDVINNEQKATLSNNDIVINKLTQILSYLRAGTRNKKKKKDRLLEEVEMKEELGSGKIRHGDDAPIYDDVDIKPQREGRKDRSRDDRRDRGGREGDRGRRGDDRREDRRDDRGDRYRDDRDIRGVKDKRHEEGEKGQQPEKNSYFDKPDEQQEPEKKGGFSAEDKAMIKALMKKEEETTKQKEEKKLAGLQANEGYAECYPGLAEMDDAIGDSDDEADYTKMDMGNKKGPVGRWDFDTTEEYADYMGKKEALPKAAYQYGVKMSDGRKTKGSIIKNSKNEKAKLDKEWNQISALIDKRKAGGGGGGGNKKAKYD